MYRQLIYQVTDDKEKIKLIKNQFDQLKYIENKYGIVVSSRLKHFFKIK